MPANGRVIVDYGFPKRLGDPSGAESGPVCWAGHRTRARRTELAAAV